MNIIKTRRYYLCWFTLMVDGQPLQVGNKLKHQEDCAKAYKQSYPDCAVTVVINGSFGGEWYTDYIVFTA